MKRYLLMFIDEGNCDIADIKVKAANPRVAVGQALDKIHRLCGAVTYSECFHAAKIVIEVVSK